MNSRFFRVFTCLAICCAACPFPSNLIGQATNPSPAIDFRFQFLQHDRLSKGEMTDEVAATIRFKSPPSAALLERIEGLGVGFMRDRGKRLGTRTVYPVRLSFAALSQLATIPEIGAIQPAWRPFHLPPLDVSRPQVQADSAWTFVDKSGHPVTGKGVLIADFDTGVDFFHPMLFFPDGDTLNWIDVNTNGVFDPGTDAVDLNKNGIADANETLNYREIPYSGVNTAGVYDSDLDFLYNDANNNGARDYGTAAGFSESSPTYGEQWFITLDANHDHRLSPGEKLVGLKTSKIRAIRDINGTVRRRGIDLISANPDTYLYGGHGTSVAGIAIGGVAGVHRLAGIAPGAEMIFASIQYNNTPRFFTDLPSMMVWAQSEGAKVMLCEDGEWVWEYLDGSSNEETMINELAAEGIVYVTPAGNLTGGGMQKTVSMTGRDTVLAEFRGYTSHQVWLSVRWPADTEDVSVSLQVDGNPFIPLAGGGGTVVVNNRSVTTYASVSPRGTMMISVAITPSDTGIFILKFVNVSSSFKRIDCMLGDDGMGWYGLARWTAPTEDNTVTWPATSDSSIGVAAYASKSIDNRINSYSGRGTRIDGVSLVDIAAPGGTVYTIGRNATYTSFGGTSSAGPHVAGAAALLLQADTSLTHTRVLQLLRSGATSDALTGTVPNNTWGYGRLRIVGALKQTSVPVTGRPALPVSWKLEQNFPNPFNGSTTITYTLPSRSIVCIAVYNLLGQLVETLLEGEQVEGPGKVMWKGNAASGVYFCRLESVAVTDRNRRSSAVIKMLVLR